MSQHKPRKSQADRLLEYVENEETSLFTDQRGKPHITIYDPKLECTRIHRLIDKSLKLWLSKLMWDKEQKAPSPESLNMALNVLGGMALEAPVIRLYNRVAPDTSGGVLIDMCDEAWRAIRVTKDGWSIQNYPPITFRRYKHQKPLPEPVSGGSIKSLLDFIHLDNLGDQLLFLVIAISYFIPEIPHPILVIYGPQGSGKSWVHRIVRSIIDPSVLGVLTLPRTQPELVQMLDHHYCAFFDNISRLTVWVSDVLCRAATGTGISKRELYSDEEDVIFEYKRCVGTNGINIPPERGDLDRCGLFKIGLGNTERRTERDLLNTIEKNQGEILGAFLDTLVKALQIHPTINPDSLFRMADFTVWGCAITEALGLHRDLFLEAYKANIHSLSVEAVRSAPVADVLIRFMENREGTLTGSNWSGSASQLWSELKDVAKEMKISTAQRAWPKTPAILGKILNELEPNLPSVGYKIHKSPGKVRKIEIVRTDGETWVNKIHDWGEGPDIRDYLERDDVELYSPKKGEIIKERTTQNLQNMLDEFLEILEKAEKVNDGEPVDLGGFFKILVVEGWKPSDAKRVSDILIRDGMIYEPRLGVIKRC